MGARTRRWLASCSVTGATGPPQDTAYLADGHLLKAAEKIGYIIASPMKDSDTGSGH